MEIFSALLALCEGNSPATGDFVTQKPVTRSFDVFFDLRPSKRLSKTIVRLVIWDADTLITTSPKRGPLCTNMDYLQSRLGWVVSFHPLETICSFTHDPCLDFSQFMRVSYDLCKYRNWVNIDYYEKRYCIIYTK